MLRVAEVAHRTDTGREREANEDSVFCRQPVFVVADGMGGARAGEVASRLAVEAFDPERDSSLQPEQYLEQTVREANRSIYDVAQSDAERSGMGTTVTAGMFSGGEVSLGHVGDSRAYLYRESELSQITQDHSLVEELHRQGRLSADEMADHPQRSVITRALGPEPDVEVDTMTVQGRDGDLFLLCSDGLTTMLDDRRIAEILSEPSTLEQTARSLVRAANDAGGRDNISVVLFRLEDDEAASASGDEGATLIGAAATEEGLTTEAVEAAVSEERERRRNQPTAGLRRAEAAKARPAAKPAAVPTGHAQRHSPWRGRILGTLGALIAIAVIGAGAYVGVRSIWFLGADEGGRVTLYRGLPYDLPFGVDLYSEDFSSPITVDALPEDRRGVAVDHELRSRDDAVSLLEDLQRAAEEQAEAERQAATEARRAEQRDGNGGGNGGDGGGSDAGGGSSGGGDGSG